MKVRALYHFRCNKVIGIPGVDLTLADIQGCGPLLHSLEKKGLILIEQDQVCNEEIEEQPKRKGRPPKKRAE